MGNFGGYLAVASLLILFSSESAFAKKKDGDKLGTNKKRKAHCKGKKKDKWYKKTDFWESKDYDKYKKACDKQYEEDNRPKGDTLYNKFKMNEHCLRTTKQSNWYKKSDFSSSKKYEEYFEICTGIYRAKNPKPGDGLKTDKKRKEHCKGKAKNKWYSKSDFWESKDYDKYKKECDKQFGKDNKPKGDDLGTDKKRKAHCKNKSKSNWYSSKDFSKSKNYGKYVDACNKQYQKDNPRKGDALSTDKKRKAHCEGKIRGKWLTKLDFWDSKDYDKYFKACEKQEKKGDKLPGDKLNAFNRTNNCKGKPKTQWYKLSDFTKSKDYEKYFEACEKHLNKAEKPGDKLTAFNRTKTCKDKPRKDWYKIEHFTKKKDYDKYFEACEKKEKKKSDLPGDKLTAFNRTKTCKDKPKTKWYQRKDFTRVEDFDKYIDACEKKAAKKSDLPGDNINWVMAPTKSCKGIPVEKWYRKKDFTRQKDYAKYIEKCEKTVRKKSDLRGDKINWVLAPTKSCKGKPTSQWYQRVDFTLASDYKKYIEKCEKKAEKAEKKNDKSNNQCKQAIRKINWSGWSNGDKKDCCDWYKDKFATAGSKEERNKKLKKASVLRVGRIILNIGEKKVRDEVMSATAGFDFTKASVVSDMIKLDELKKMIGKYYTDTKAQEMMKKLSKQWGKNENMVKSSVKEVRETLKEKISTAVSIIDAQDKDVEGHLTKWKAAGCKSGLF